ncbi:response regulator [Rhizobium sp. EC-SD404]|uniref:response regulator n=1 Tax=Rhizobium sp. EC-SD404 TaxID=2038389 RepID=UPI00125336C1|nr:response regulator [Rhizobium sp. EC-SD404]VVS96483.1 CheY chemotaxis protein or a CheY-like REC (Receiver) domain [Rhizobium sp. EC-SD404]
MNHTPPVVLAPIRLLYLEDNPLIVFHVEQMIEDLGHVFVGALDSFSELQKQFTSLEFDGALVDIDLADGPTGPEAAAWLHQRGIHSIFVTGQERVASAHSNVSIGIVSKPVSPTELFEKIELFNNWRGR